MKLKALSVLAAGACAIFCVPPLSGAEEPSKKEIDAAMVSPDSLVRHNTWKKLNPEDSNHYKIILHILKNKPWYDRQAAILTLTKAASDETLKKMAKDMKDNKDPAVRQGLAVALARMEDEKCYPQLFEMLKDKSALVRRMVVHALGITKKKKEKVEALVKAFQTETDPVVKSFFVNALNDQTQAFQGPSPVAWATWWMEAQSDPDFELGKTDEVALKKAEELGNKLKQRKTVSVVGGVTLETEERGNIKASPILILPEYGYSREIMKPFLAELEKTNKLFYIDLPDVKSFKEVPTGTAKNIPYYPIDKLVDAFEDLRKETKQERFALMACGLSSWIAMRYATKYPKSVSHMVFICPYSSNKAFSDGVDRMEREGKAKNDVELEHLALTHSILQSGESRHDQLHTEKKIPMPDGEMASLDRRQWSTFFKDERDGLLEMLYPKKDRNLGGVLIPEFRCFTEPVRKIPTIVIVGAGSIMNSVEDCRAVAKHYGGQFYLYPNSARMPFCEESTVFNKHMALLIREVVKKSPKAKGTKEDADEEKESGEGESKTKVKSKGKTKTIDKEKEKKKDKEEEKAEPQEEEKH